MNKKTNTLLIAGAAIVALLFFTGMLDPVLSSLGNKKAPIDLEVYASTRYVKQSPATETTIYEEHWMDCKTFHVESGTRSDGDTYGSWYHVCEGLPTGEHLANVGDGTTQLLRTNDDYTSPIMLIHDGCQGWGNQWCDSWIVAVMQMDGCGKADIYWDCNGEQILLWEDVTSCDENKKQQGFKPIAKLLDKTTCDINTFDISGTPIGSPGKATDVDLSNS